MRDCMPGVLTVAERERGVFGEHSDSLKKGPSILACEKSGKVSSLLEMTKDRYWYITDEQGALEQRSGPPHFPHSS